LFIIKFFFSKLSELNNAFSNLKNQTISTIKTYIFIIKKIINIYIYIYIYILNVHSIKIELQ
ncbi:MAG: hypothetical protein N7Q72_01000, partial [Spiroplasma sp. Tabriz.8]|nr:hypothetical protein [Spiroplasma sp. Tabriz.8]